MAIYCFYIAKIAKTGEIVKIANSASAPCIMYFDTDIESGIANG